MKRRRGSSVDSTGQGRRVRARVCSSSSEDDVPRDAGAGAPSRPPPPRTRRVLLTSLRDARTRRRSERPPPVATFRPGTFRDSEEGGSPPPGGPPSEWALSVARKIPAVREAPVLHPPFKMDTLRDILDVAWYYKGSTPAWFRLWKLIPILTDLDRMVGMASLKRSVADMVLYYIQDLHTVPPLLREEGGQGPEGARGEADTDTLHTVIYGAPGSGKTTVAKILARVYHAMGFLPTDNVVYARREDFIGKYIGHSEEKTRHLLDRAIGGVLFIDEAYSLSQGEDSDKFSQAVVDILTGWLLEHNHDCVCIIAGYKEDMERNFFGANLGLSRRFFWRFEVDEYTSEQLRDIFVLRVKRAGWHLAPGAAPPRFFQAHRASFPFLGGDMDSLFFSCKMAHTRRLFGTTQPSRHLTAEDVTAGFERYKLTMSQTTHVRRVDPASRPLPEGMFF